ncbi:MAG: AI-2E family transporter [Kiritimatiellae bacterium]|nr:AI-2E family transporter [Kiritimatiellia bacterium]
MNDETVQPLRLGAKQSRIVASAITLVALCVLFVLGAAVFWLAVSVVDRYRLVLLPPIVAVILANVVQPVFDATRRALWTRLSRVDPPHRLRIPKGAVTAVAIAAAVLCILLPLVLFLWLCGKLLVDQLLSLPDAMPDIGAWLHAKAPQLAAYIDQHGLLSSIQNALQSEWLSGSVLSDKAVAAAGVAISHAAEVVQFVAAWLMVPVYMVIYLASRPLEGRDFAKMMVGVTSRTRENVRFLIDEFIRIVVSYFRGQVLVAIIEGPLYGVGFQYVAGVPNGLLLGVAVGLVNIAPYMGTVFVMPIVCLVAYAHGGLVSVLLAVFVWAAVGLSDFFISPRISGSRTGLGVFAVIFSILFWGTVMGGLFGVFLAVPLTAFLAVCGRLLVREYFVDDSVPAAPAALPAPPPAETPPPSAG